MSVTLTLHSNMGNLPAWGNPNVWAGDINANPVTPKVGQSCYLWSTAANTGDEDAQVTVQFYWGDPSLAMIYGNMQVVGYGSGFVSAGGSQNIICNTAWVPVYVNGGHECLVAVCGAIEDPPPPTQSNDMVNANDQQTAMQNLAVIKRNISISNISYKFSLPAANNLTPGEGVVKAHRATISEYQAVLRMKGLSAVPDEARGAKNFYISHADPAITPNGLPIDLGKEFAVTPAVDHNLSLMIDLHEDPDSGTGALYIVEYFVKDVCIGGIGVLVQH